MEETVDVNCTRSQTFYVVLVNNLKLTFLPGEP